MTREHAALWRLFFSFVRMLAAIAFAVWAVANYFQGQS